MSRVDSVNKTYSTIYKKLGTFAISPYNWSMYEKKTDYNYMRAVPCAEYQFVMDTAKAAAWAVYQGIIDTITKIILSPILLPATVITMGLSAIGAVLTAVAHSLSFVGAVTADLRKPEISQASEFSINWLDCSC